MGGNREDKNVKKSPEVRKERKMNKTPGYKSVMSLSGVL